MEIGEKINPFIGCREFNPVEIINVIRRTIRSWSWGARDWRTIGNKGFRFAVQGHHHKGHVYVSLAYNNTFTLYFTSRQGTIKEIIDNVYIDMLIDTIDKFVEYIPEYGNN